MSSDKAQQAEEREAELAVVWRAYHGADRERCELRAELSKQRGLANHAEHRAHVFAEEADALRAANANLRGALIDVTDILAAALGLTDKHAEVVKRARAVLAEGVRRGDR